MMSTFHWRSALCTMMPLHFPPVGVSCWFPILYTCRNLSFSLLNTLHTGWRISVNHYNYHHHQQQQQQQHRWSTNRFFLHECHHRNWIIGIRHARLLN